MTARMSSMRVSRSGIPTDRSESPVPRFSKMIRRANDAIRRMNSAGDPSHATSLTVETIQPLTKTTSNGPSPTTEYAILTSPLLA